jgi:hypothetical protein
MQRQTVYTTRSSDRFQRFTEGWRGIVPGGPILAEACAGPQFARAVKKPYVVLLETLATEYASIRLVCLE